ncbi:MAG: hypothetical protein H6739_31230 [Alphaproteobacteria bacterium]|nr:hypothetical protein [Alphaproteobacteria bacterium]
MFLFALLACHNDDAPTFHADVRPLLEQHCLSCHIEGGAAPFALEDWTTVDAMAPAIVDAVAERRMPPYSYNPDCRETYGSLWLDDDTLETFALWAEGGYAEGDPEDYVAPALPEPPAPLTPDLVLRAASPYLPDTDDTDDYRCLPVGEPLADDLFVRGITIDPDNLSVVHHVILYAVPPGDLDALAALDAADPAEGYACFGDTGLTMAQSVGGWAPGTQDEVLPEDTAIRVPAGSRLVLQVHYYTGGQSDISADRTAVGLVTLPPEARPDYVIATFPVVVADLRIEPGDPASVQTSTQRLPIDGLVVGTAPHMHTLGTALRTEVVRADGSTECLSQIEPWDFDWQRSYSFVDAVPLSYEDEVALTCVYDNSPENQRPGVEPRTVRWGDGTDDEMCLDYIAYLVPWTGGQASGTCAGYDTCAEGCAPGDAFCGLACAFAAGESCGYCGLEGLFGDCLTGACEQDFNGLGLCLMGCNPDPGSLIGCLHDECRPWFDAYQDCAADKAGACLDDFVGCEEIAD